MACPLHLQSVLDPRASAADTTNITQWCGPLQPHVVSLCLMLMHDDSAMICRTCCYICRQSHLLFTLSTGTAMVVLPLLEGALQMH